MSRLSDKTASGPRSRRNTRVSRKKGWSDLDLSLKLHPFRKDIMSLKDDAAIKNAVRNLLISNFYERPFQPTLGANLRGLLFEPADAITRIALKEGIRNVLVNHEPRIRVQNVQVIDLSEKNAYRINVIFNIKEFDTSEEVEVLLQRIR
jgi:phage baseplate assembly protein W